VGIKPPKGGRKWQPNGLSVMWGVCETQVFFIGHSEKCKERGPVENRKTLRFNWGGYEKQKEKELAETEGGEDALNQVGKGPRDYNFNKKKAVTWLERGKIKHQKNELKTTLLGNDVFCQVTGSARKKKQTYRKVREMSPTGRGYQSLQPMGRSQGRVR